LLEQQLQSNDVIVGSDRAGNTLTTHSPKLYNIKSLETGEVFISPPTKLVKVALKVFATNTSHLFFFHDQFLSLRETIFPWIFVII
jgi:hypothetical protein